MPKKHRVEVDQSGRTDDTGPVVLALSNGIQDSILLLGPERSKVVQAVCRKGRLRKTDQLRVFSACVFVLLKPHLARLSEVAIDIEYEGHSEDVKGMLVNHIRSVLPSFNTDAIWFKQIGQRSRAHKLALSVYRKRTTARRKVKAAEILRLLR